MKRLNRKGFTLIELLAVVVIMAVILVVTIPSVLSTMANARQKQLQNAADSVQEWFTKQREIDILGSSLGSSTLDGAYNTFAYAEVSSTAPKTFNAGAKANLTAAVLTAAGLADPATNFVLDTTGNSSTAQINGNKICIKLTAKSGGSLYNNAASGTNTNYATSSGCN